MTQRERIAEWHKKYPGKRAEYSRKWRAAHPEQKREEARQYRRAKPETVAGHLMKYRYGITRAEYDRLLSAQGGLCAACHRPPEKRCLDVDHDHTTGRVRGLLCNPCNITLGRCREGGEWLRKLADYIEANGSQLREVS